MRVWPGLTDSPSWWAMMSAARGTLIFDVGANVGQCAHLFAPHFAQVVSYEPCAEAYALLYAERPSNVETVPSALSDHIGTVSLAVSSKSIETGQLTSGVCAEEGMGWGEVIGWRTCPCTTIDRECRTYGFPDAVKVDTEGSEMAILAGAAILIDRHATTWYLEMHNRASERPARDLFEGYRISVVDHDYAPAPWSNFYMLCTPEAP